MLTITSSTKIYVATGATDMRKSFNGLYALVLGTLEQDPLHGHLFLFCNRRRDRLKVFFWDGTGFWVCAKRLEKGVFHWPEASTGSSVRLTHHQLQMLLGGASLQAIESVKF